MSKKIIRLTESELSRLVKRIVEEEQTLMTSSSIPKDYCKVKLYDTVVVDDESQTVYRGGKKQTIRKGMVLKENEIIGVYKDDIINVHSKQRGGPYSLYCLEDGRGNMGPLE